LFAYLRREIMGNMLINYLAAISRDMKYSRIGLLIVYGIFQLSCLHVQYPRIRSMHALLIGQSSTDPHIILQPSRNR
jgi:hypothetical protein